MVSKKFAADFTHMYICVTQDKYTVHIQSLNIILFIIPKKALNKYACSMKNLKEYIEYIK